MIYTESEKEGGMVVKCFFFSPLVPRFLIFSVHSTMMITLLKTEKAFFFSTFVFFLCVVVAITDEASIDLLFSHANILY